MTKGRRHRQGSRIGPTLVLDDLAANIVSRVWLTGFVGDYGYILESGRIMLDCPAKALADNKDVKEFYLGMSSEGRKSFRDMKSYRRRKRWV
jgi:hypothetical protein